LAPPPYEVWLSDASLTLCRRSKQPITRPSTGKYPQKLRDLRVDLEPGVLVLVDSLYARDGPINFPSELLNSALVKRFVILVLVQGWH
jgi:hypothetical protein